MRKEDFSSKQDFKDYKNARSELNDAKSDFNTKNGLYINSQKAIDEYKANEPDKFNEYNNKLNKVNICCLKVITKKF